MGRALFSLSLLVFCPVRHAAAQTPPPHEIQFEVVSIQPVEHPDPRNFWGAQPGITPDGYESGEQQSLWATIMLAYYSGLQSPLSWQRSMLQGGPPWFMKNQYRIDARVAPEDRAAWRLPDPGRKMLDAALQQMLKDRCKLALHTLTTEQTVYALRIKPGAKLKLTSADPNEPLPGGVDRVHGDGAMHYTSVSTIRFYGMSMRYLTAFLTAFGADRLVLDQTGLKGGYDFVMTQRPRDEIQDRYDNPWDLDSLGLRLEKVRAPVETLVIDHIEEPSAN